MTSDNNGKILKYLVNRRPAIRIYHNVSVRVTTGKIDISKLRYWKDNARTFLNIKRIQHETGRSIYELTDDELLDQMITDPKLELRELAKSIDKNGVRVPITLTENGRLIDGNRRLFSCKILVRDYVNRGEKPPGHVLRIPADVIPPLPKILEKLVVAEANYMEDFKVKWPREVKAAVIAGEYEKARRRGFSRDKAYGAIRRIYGINIRTINKFLEIENFTKEFVRSFDKEKQLETEAIVKDKWNCFEDFINKTRYGRYKLVSKAEFKELKEKFFSYVYNDVINTMTDVRELIDCHKDEVAWKMVDESAGLRLHEAAALARASLSIKSYPERIEQFTKFLENLDRKKLAEISDAPLKKLLAAVNSALTKMKRG